jgi:sulfur carrier protein ThiS
LPGSFTIRGNRIYVGENDLDLSTREVLHGPFLREIYEVLCVLSRDLMRIILPDRSVRTFTGDPLRIEQILAELGMNAAAVIVVKNGKVVPEDDIADENDEIRIIRVAHGG